jgi:glycerate kinase
MHVLVASDRIGAMSSRQAGQVIAGAWAGSTAWVVPVGEAGRGFVEAYVERHEGVLDTAVDSRGVVLVGRTPEGVALHVEPVGSPPGRGIPYAGSSHLLGAALVEVLGTGPPPRRIVLDLAGLQAHDAGAGFLAAMGANADVPLTDGVRPLAGCTWVDLLPVRRRLEGLEVVGVAGEADLDIPLTGLRGITSRLGRALGESREPLLAVDAALDRFTRAIAPGEASRPGAGAGGGLGYALLTLGAQLTTGPRLLLSSLSGPRPDLVVTGCDVFDFAHRGGGVISEAARLAAGALCPCIVLAGEVLIGVREMRMMGVESAYALRGAHQNQIPAVAERELADLARRVARSWRW